MWKLILYCLLCNFPSTRNATQKNVSEYFLNVTESLNDTEKLSRRREEIIEKKLSLSIDRWYSKLEKDDDITINLIRKYTLISLAQVPSHVKYSNTLSDLEPCPTLAYLSGLLLLFCSLELIFWKIEISFFLFFLIIITYMIKILTSIFCTEIFFKD